MKWVCRIAVISIIAPLAGIGSGALHDIVTAGIGMNPSSRFYRMFEDLYMVCMVFVVMGIVFKVFEITGLEITTNPDEASSPTCPHCGESIEQLTANCPLCGDELPGSSTT